MERFDRLNIQFLIDPKPRKGREKRNVIEKKKNVTEIETEKKTNVTGIEAEIKKNVTEIKKEKEKEIGTKKYLHLPWMLNRQKPLS